ncbi:hypothetical protein PR048_011685 [Dryococelus australis]|uniref:Uncharacterized protein n=1 Tax=Dryococelus australis TaxID=614101 RepID=A0ABQ9HMK7_9NEOP|nr:hypothetical protein PR048_011685 [Dryococelus australis]
MPLCWEHFIIQNVTIGLCVHATMDKHQLSYANQPAWCPHTLPLMINYVRIMEPMEKWVAYPVPTSISACCNIECKLNFENLHVLVQLSVCGEVARKKTYRKWCTQREYYLGHEDLWDLVSNSKGSTKEIAEAQHKRDTKVRCKIGMLVHSQCHVLLEGKDTTKKMWEALKVAYENTGANIVCIFLERLFDIKPKKCSSMEQYVTKILGAAQEVTDAGCKLEHTLIAMLLLRGLTSEFQPLRITLQTSIVQLTTDYVKGQLLQQEYTPGGREGTLGPGIFHSEPWAKQSRCYI